MAGSRTFLVASAALLVAASIPGAALDLSQAPWTEADDVPRTDPPPRLLQGLESPATSRDSPVGSPADPCGAGSLAAGDTCSKWTRRRDADGNRDFGGDQAIGPDGTLYVVHRDEGNLTVVAHDPVTGETLWSRLLDPPGEVVPSSTFGWGVTAVAAYVDGAVVVAAEVTDPTANSSVAHVAALDPGTGATQWTHRHAAATGGDAEPMGLFASGQGDQVLLAYAAFGDDPRTRPEVVAFDADTGTLAWSAAPDPLPGHNDYPVDVAHDPARGALVFTGVSFTDTDEDYEAFVTAVDTAAEAPDWSQAWDGPNALAGSAVAASAEGSSFYVVLHDHDRGNYGIRALDPVDGTPEWFRSYTPFQGEGDHEVEATLGPQGDTLFLTANVYVRPDPLLYDERNDVLAVATASGQVEWQADDGASPGETKDPRDIVAPPGSTCVFTLTVSITKPRLPDYRVVAYDRSTGEQVWKRFVGSAERAWPELPADLAWNGGLLHLTGSLQARPVDSPVHIYVLGKWLPPGGLSGGWSATTSTFAPPC